MYLLFQYISFHCRNVGFEVSWRLLYTNILKLQKGHRSITQTIISAFRGNCSILVQRTHMFNGNNHISEIIEQR